MSDDTTAAMTIDMKDGQVRTIVDHWGTSVYEAVMWPTHHQVHRPPGGYDIGLEDHLGSRDLLWHHFDDSAQVERFCAERGIECEVRADGSVVVTPPKVEHVTTWSVSTTPHADPPVLPNAPAAPARRRWRWYR